MAEGQKVKIKRSDLEAKVTEQAAYETDQEKGGPLERSLQTQGAQAAKTAFEDMVRTNRFSRGAVMGGAAAVIVDQLPLEMRDLLNLPKKAIEKKVSEMLPGSIVDVQANPKHISISILDPLSKDSSMHINFSINPTNPRDGEVTLTLSKRIELSL